MSLFDDRAARAVGGFGHWILRLPPGSILEAVGVGMVLFLLTFWANWRIVKRSGHPGCMSLMMYVPCIGVFFLLWFAFSRWPVQDGKRA